MALKWNDVADTNGFKSSTPEQQETTRNKFFEDRVAPTVSPDRMSTVREAYDAKTLPRPAKAAPGVANPNSNIAAPKALARPTSAQQATPRGISRPQTAPGSEGFVEGVKDFGRGLVAGTVQNLPDAAAGLADYTDTPEFDGRGAKIGDEGGASRWARGINAKGEGLAEGWQQSEFGRQMQERDAFSVRGSAYEAGKNLPMSFGPGLAGAAAGFALGGLPGAAGGYVAGSLAALPLFFGHQAKDTYDKVYEETRASNPELTDEQAHDTAMTAGGLTGGIEAGGELVADLVGAKLFKMLPSGAKKNLTKAATRGFQGVVPMAKELSKVLGTEVATELAQGAGQSEVEKSFGVGEGATWDNQKGVIMPTILMTLVGGGAGVGMSANQRYRTAKVLQNTNIPPEQRMAAVDSVAQVLAQEDPELARLFFDSASKQVQAGQPVIAQDDRFYTDLKPLEQRAEDKRMAAGDFTGEEAEQPLPGQPERPAKPDFQEVDDAGAPIIVDSQGNAAVAPEADPAAPVTAESEQPEVQEMSRAERQSLTSDIKAQLSVVRMELKAAQEAGDEGAVDGLEGEIRAIADNFKRVLTGQQPVSTPRQKTEESSWEPGALTPQSEESEPRPVLQNRDRSTPASVEQMNQIAADPDYTRLGFSRDFANGAPVVEPGIDLPPEYIGRDDVATTATGRQIPVQYAVVEADELLASNNADGSKVDEYADGVDGMARAIAGNGRVAGIQSAYAQGNGATYMDDMSLDGDLHGIDQGVIQGMVNPVLVRIMPQGEITDTIGDESNTSGTAELSPKEQAHNDTKRIDVNAIELDDNGEVSRSAVEQFIASMPIAERAGLLDGKEPNRKAYERLGNAVFAQAYESDELLRLAAEATDDEVRNLMVGLKISAGKMSRLKGSGEYDVRPLVVEAAETAVNAKRNGTPLKQFLEQADMGRNPFVVPIIEMLADNIRSPKKIGEHLSRLADTFYDESERADVDMFGDVEKRPPQQIMDELYGTGKNESQNDQTPVIPERPADDTGGDAGGPDVGAVEAGNGQDQTEVEEAEQVERDFEAEREEFKREASGTPEEAAIVAKFGPAEDIGTGDRGTYEIGITNFKIVKDRKKNIKNAKDFIASTKESLARDIKRHNRLRTEGVSAVTDPIGSVDELLSMLGTSLTLTANHVSYDNVMIAAGEKLLAEQEHEVAEEARIKAELKAGKKPGKKKAAKNTKTALDTKAQSIDDEIAAAGAELAALLKPKPGTLNTGVDPQILLVGTKLGALYIQKGVVKFAQWSLAIVEQMRALGVDADQIKPHLKEMYGATQQRVSDEQFDQMDDTRSVRAFDLDTLDVVETPVGDTQTDLSVTDDTQEESFREKQDRLIASEFGSENPREVLETLQTARAEHDKYVKAASGDETPAGNPIPQEGEAGFDEYYDESAKFTDLVMAGEERLWDVSQELFTQEYIVGNRSSIYAPVSDALNKWRKSGNTTGPIDMFSAKAETGGDQVFPSPDILDAVSAMVEQNPNVTGGEVAEELGISAIEAIEYFSKVKAPSLTEKQVIEAVGRGGAVFKNLQGTMFYTVTPPANGNDKYQVTVWDKKGAISDSRHNTASNIATYYRSELSAVSGQAEFDGFMAGSAPVKSKDKPMRVLQTEEGRRNPETRARAWRRLESYDIEKLRSWDEIYNNGDPNEEYEQMEQRLEDAGIDSQDRLDFAGVESFIADYVESYEDKATGGDQVIPLPYGSGMSRPGDFKAAIKSGAGVGVELNELSKSMMDEVAKAVVDGNDVFIDSGAFREFKAAEKAGIPQKEINYDAILDKYLALAERIDHDGGSRATAHLMLVMPDVVGDQKKTLALLKLHKEKIEKIGDLGAEIIIPFQRGDKSQREVYIGLKDTFDTPFVVGIPSNAEALSDEDFRNLLSGTYQPDRIHILGAARPASLERRMKVIREMYTDQVPGVTADANLIRSKIDELKGSGDQRSEKITEIIRAELPDAFKPGTESPENDAGTETDLFGAVPVKEQTLADAQREKKAADPTEENPEIIESGEGVLDGKQKNNPDGGAVIQLYKEDGKWIGKGTISHQGHTRQSTYSFEYPQETREEALRLALSHIEQRAGHWQYGPDSHEQTNYTRAQAGGITKWVQQQQRILNTPQGEALTNDADGQGTMFGAAPVAEQSLADAQREKDDKRSGGKDVPADVDGGLFSNQQDQIDITDTPTSEEITTKANESATSPTNNLADPTEAQIEADNYKKGEPFTLHGQKIVIENPKGSERKGTDQFGKAWSNTMGAHYGDIKGTLAADGDALDVFVGEYPESTRIYVIDQKKTKGSEGGFDEHKVMMGFDGESDAIDAYLDSYDWGWEVGPITDLSIDRFKEWINTGDHTKAIENQKIETADDVKFKADQAERSASVLASAIENADETISMPKAQWDNFHDKTYSAQSLVEGKGVKALPLPDGRLAMTQGVAFFGESSHTISYTIVPADEYQGETFTQDENYKKWDKGEGRRGDSRGMRTKHRGKDVVLDKAIIITMGEGAYSLGDHLYQGIDSITNNRDLKKMVAEFNDVKPAAVTPQQMKEAQELVELAIVRRARETMNSSQNERAVYDKMVEQYNSQPLLNVRSSTSMENQAYSTPAPLAMIASQYAGIDIESEVFEPTAGNGMLLIGSQIDNSAVNELNDERAENLRSLGYEVSQNNAAEKNIIPAKTMDAVIMNPPFGRLRSENGKIREVKVDGYNISAIDHLIAAKHLNAMKNDGRAVLIIGANKEAGGLAAHDRVFFNWLYSNYNVEQHFEVDGNLYKRQGAGWPVRVIVIAGRQESKTFSPKAGTIERLETWEQIYDRYNETVDSVGQRPDLLGEAIVKPEGGRQSEINATSGRPNAGQTSEDAGQGGRSSGSTESSAGSLSTGDLFGEQPGQSGSDSTVGQQPGIASESSKPEQGLGGSTGGSAVGGRSSGRPTGATKTQPASVSHKAKSYGTKNKVVTKSAAEEAIARLIASKNNLNTGLNPKSMADAVLVATYHIEAGARKFVDYATAMVDSLGDWIKPHLRQLYEMVRFAPDMTEYQAQLDDAAVIAVWEAEQKANAPIKAAPPKSKAKPVSTSDFQSEYPAQSSGFNENTLIPNNLKGVTKESLERLEAAIGKTVDDYVMEKLNYSSLDEMFSPTDNRGLMGLQVDAIAAAIYNFEERGKGIIIADQTGVGKGRQAAAILRYAKIVGKTPVFVTVADNLYTDMYDDLDEIGEKNVKPLILNADVGIDSKYGKVSPLKNTKSKPHRQDAFDYMIENGQLPQGNDMLFATYSQINTDNKQRKVMEALKGNAIFVLDESHKAAGDRETVKKVDGEKVTLMTGAGFIYNIIKDSPVMYLSATYAKRADNMPVYYRTDLMDAVDSIDELITAVERGGVPMQQIMASMLAESGQLFRRERSFEGISIPAITDYENSAKHRVMADHVTEGLSHVVDADVMFQDVFFEQFKAEAEESGGTASMAGNKASSGLDHGNFNAVIHNYVKQMLLAVKAEAAADSAIAAFNEGKKPIIALENTMGSFLNDYVKTNGLKVGDEVKADYRDILHKALERTRRISRKDARGNPMEPLQIEMNQLDSVTGAAYQRAMDVIDALPLTELPLSPIDFMRQRMEDAGMTTSEVTGRDFHIDYSSGKAILARFKASDKVKRPIVDKFNSIDGNLDSLIMNVAGATGLSIHASEKHSDQKVRKMIVAQPMQDVNVLMQMLGRINRTGQVVLPEYEMLYVDLPAEKRPAAMTSKKLASLNANTSANDESDTSIKAPDMLNQYGDKIVNEFLKDNLDLARKLDVSVTNATPEQGFASKVTGRLARLKVTVQEDFYQEVEANYKDEIDYLNRTGQNLLIASTVDLDAKIQDSRVVYEGKAPDTIFGGNTTLHKIDAKYQGKPPTAKEVIQALEKGKKGIPISAVIAAKESDTAFEDKLNQQLTKKKAVLADHIATGEPGDVFDERLATLTADVTTAMGNIEAYNDVKRNAIQRMKEYELGAHLSLDAGEELVTGVLTSIKDSHKSGKGNPWTASKTRYTFMINNGSRQLPLTLGKLAADQEVVMSRLRTSGTTGLEDIFEDRLQTGRREQRYVATGNLISGMAKLEGGRIVNFTDKDGATHQGILMTKKFGKNGEFATAGGAGEFAIRDAAVIKKLLNDGDQGLFKTGGVFSGNRLVKITKDRSNKYIVEIPRAKKDSIGNSVRYDKELRDIFGDFYSKTKMMQASFNKDQIDAVVDRMMEITPLYISTGVKDLAVAAGAPELIEAVNSFDGDPANAQVVEKPKAVAKPKPAPAASTGPLTEADRVPARDRGPLGKIPKPSNSKMNTWDIPNTKTGDMTYMASAKDRVSRDDFSKLRATAKKNGGYWSRFGKAGFLFKTAAERQAFVDEVSAAPGENTLYSKSAILGKGAKPKGMSVEKAQELVDEFRAKYKGVNDGLQVLVHRTQDGAFGPEIRKKYNRIKGGFDPETNTLHIVSENIDNDSDIRSTIRHELFVHKGLGLLAESDQAKLLDIIAREAPNSKTLGPLWAKVQKNYKDETVAIQAEELLAMVAEGRYNAADKVWIKIVNWIRNALTKIGLIDPTLTRKDLMSIVYDMGDAFAEGRQARQRDMGEQLQATGTAEEFYSTLATAAGNLKQEKGAPAQMLASMKKMGGVKDEELEWSGLPEYLATIGKSVTKDQIVDYLDANGVQVETVTLGEGANPYDDMVINVTQYLAEAKMWSVRFANGMVIAIHLGPRVLKSAVEDAARQKARDNSQVEGGAQYGEYVLPGGTNYREVLLTLPPEIKTESDEDFDARKAEYIEREAELYRVIQVDDGLWTAIDPGGFDMGSLDSSLSEQEAYALIDETVERKAETVLSKITQHKNETFESGHYSNHPNLLAHIRLNDRVGENGEKVLFVEEIQSDWHQEGRREGYSGDTTAIQAERDKLQDKIETKVGRYYNTLRGTESLVRTHPNPDSNLKNIVAKDMFISLSWDIFSEPGRPDRSETTGTRGQVVSNALLDMPPIEFADLKTEVGKYNELGQNIYKTSAGGVPDAPFKGNAWVELSAKKILRIAAEGGYDRVAWTTGKQQADRYNLSDKVSSIQYEQDTDGSDNYDLDIIISTEKTIEEADITIKRIAELLGKDIADKIQNGEGAPVNPDDGYRNWMSLSGNDLEIGGEGMKSFYDKNLPNVFKKVARKLDKAATVDVSALGEDGGTTYTGTIGVHVDAGTAPEILKHLRELGFTPDEASIDHQMDWVIAINSVSEDKRDIAIMLAKKYDSRFIPFETGEKVQRVTNHTGINITPDMSNKAMEQGQTLFRVEAVPKGMDMAKPARMKRAKEMGFDISQTWYHGTHLSKMIDSFDPETRGRSTRTPSAKQAFFFSDSPNIANMFASLAGRNKGTMARFEGKEPTKDGADVILPVYAALKNPLVVDEKSFTEGISMDKLIGIAVKDGHDGLIVNNSSDSPAWPVLVVDGKTHMQDYRGQFMSDTMPLYAKGEMTAAEVLAEIDDYISYLNEPDAMDEMAFDKEDFDREVSEWQELRNVWAKDPSKVEITKPRSTVMAVFDPNLIRSVNAAFNPAEKSNPGILFRVAGEQAEENTRAPWRDSLRDRIDGYRFQMQDKLIDLKRIQEGENPEDHANPYQKAAIWEGRAGERVNDFDEDSVQPLLGLIAQTGVSWDDVGNWLVARHAEEANEYLAEINPDMEGEDRYRLSGMSDEEAQEILDKHSNNKNLWAVGEKVDRINRERVEMLVSDGLITQEMADAWQGRYQHYVPLKREEAEGSDHLPSRGQGFNIKGRESKMRTGSAYWTPGKIVANTIAQYESGVVRGEKNKVGQAMLDFVKAHPDDNFWHIDTDRTSKSVRNGKVVVTQDGWNNSPNELTVKEDGVEHIIAFNIANERAARLVVGLKNLQAAEMGSVMRGMATVTRFLATINTSWNPEFMVSNFFRDIQTAAYNLSDTDIASMRTQVMKDVLPAMNGIRSALFGDGSGEWAESWEDFRKHGGKTGWIDIHGDILKKEGDIKKMHDRLTDGKAAHSTFSKLIKSVEDMNNVIENGARLAAYKSGIDAGLSKDRAAAMAKDLTVNFNRKGNRGAHINAMYMFFNAAVQGNVRLLQAMANSKQGRNMAYATVGFAIALDMINRSLSGDDDDGENLYDTLPDYVKGHNIIVMGENGPLVKIPAPWGYNVLHTMGQVMGEAMTKGETFNALEASSRVGMAIIDAFNPMGSGTIAQVLSPTVTDPIVQMAENKNFAGNPLKPAHTFDSKIPRPEYRMHWSNVREASKSIAKFLNDTSGGNEIRPGKINVSPEWIDLLVDTVTGGLGKTAANTLDTVNRLATGKELPTTNVPFLRKVTGYNNEFGLKGRYYDWSQGVAYAKSEMKSLRGSDLIEARKNPQFKMIGLYTGTEKQLKAMRKVRKQMVERGADEGAVEKLDDRIRGVMARFNKRYVELVLK